MSEFRILERCDLYQPQIKIALYENLWFCKTKYEWCTISKKGEKWQKNYKDALSIIEQYKTDKDIYHYID